jgi:hypothetical protein
MRWADTMKATALAALAERSATAGFTTVETQRIWDAHEVWLSRVRRPRELPSQSIPAGSTTQPVSTFAARRR